MWGSASARGETLSDTVHNSRVFSAHITMLVLMVSAPDSFLGPLPFHPEPWALVGIGSAGGPYGEILPSVAGFYECAHQTLPQSTASFPMQPFRRTAADTYGPRDGVMDLITHTPNNDSHAQQPEFEVPRIGRRQQEGEGSSAQALAGSKTLLICIDTLIIVCFNGATVTETMPISSP